MNATGSAAIASRGMTTNSDVSVAHPIATGWASATKTGAQNYDEFATDSEVTAAIAANPSSVLAIEMPHRTSEAVRNQRSFSDSLDGAAQRWWSARESGDFREVNDMIGLYRIKGNAGEFFGVFCLVDTDQISSSIEEPGAVIRNEDVFIEKVRERVALTGRLGAALSPVLLMKADGGRDLHAAIRRISAESGEPDVIDIDQRGDEHAVWLLGPGVVRDELLALAGGGELIVADGNHRTLAAQLGGLRRFLAVITTSEAVSIAPYNRLVHDLGGRSAGELADALIHAGAKVDIELDDHAPQIPDQQGVVTLYVRGSTWRVTLPAYSGSVVDTLDHTVIERLLFADVLELQPDDKRISYVGGDYPASWLARQVDDGKAELAVLMAPVRVDDFIAVNLDRLKMPRKSTWFTPKARAGLLCAQV